MTRKGLDFLARNTATASARAGSEPASAGRPLVAAGGVGGRLPRADGRITLVFPMPDIAGEMIRPCRAVRASDTASAEDRTGTSDLPWPIRRRGSPAYRPQEGFEQLASVRLVENFADPPG